jgi:mercuric ion transport protein
VKDKVVLGGSIMAAIAASLCCIGPLVAVVLGLGTFGAAAAFEALRPYLISVTALLLAGAFYLTYRKRAVTCEGGACQVRSASRASKIMLWIVTITVIAFAAFPYYSAALLRANTQTNDPAATLNATAGVASPTYSSQQSQPAIATALIGVEGMTCAACAATIRLALDRVKGVSSAEVSFERKEAQVTYDPALTTPDQLKAAIDAAGFKAVSR